MTSLFNLQGRPWTPGPVHPIIGESDLHVWRVSVDLEPNALLQCRHVMSEGELLRANGFRVEQDRNRWIACRALLRVVLGRYLSQEAGNIAFREPLNRKPALVFNGHDVDLRFNVSHSGGVALFAIGIGRDVGVDVELVRDELDSASIWGRILSDREAAALQAMDADLRHSAFFRHWTCKEAYVKTIGAGLSYPMTRLTLDLTADGRVEVSDSSDEGEWGGPIRLRQLSVGPQHCAAVACVGEMAQLRCWHGPMGVPIGLWRASHGRDRFAA